MRNGKGYLGGTVALAVVAVVAVAIFWKVVEAGGTQGVVEFSFTTTTTKAKYAPKNVVAVWITDARGGFVRTVFVRARGRKKYLFRWCKETGRNTADAVTGATLKKHTPHTVRWDCRDAKGNVVRDGVYAVQVEFAEAHKQGPTTPSAHVTFTKGKKSVTVKPRDLDHYKDMTLVYGPGGR